MAATKFASSSVNIETILHHVKLLKTCTTPEIRDSIQILDGYDLGNKLFSIAANDFLKKSKMGDNNSQNVYTITAAGKQRLIKAPHRIQNPEDIIYKPAGTRNFTEPVSSPKKQLEIIPPAPAYSSTAQSAMDLLSSIIDANEQARKALESVYMTVEGYFTANPLDNLPDDAGPFTNVIDEMESFRAILEQIKTITEPDLQGVEQNEPSQESLID